MLVITLWASPTRFPQRDCNITLPVIVIKSKKQNKKENNHLQQR